MSADKITVYPGRLFRTHMTVRPADCGQTVMPEVGIVAVGIQFHYTICNGVFGIEKRERPDNPGSGAGNVAEGDGLAWTLDFFNFHSGAAQAVDSVKAAGNVCQLILLMSLVM